MNVITILCASQGKNKELSSFIAQEIKKQGKTAEIIDIINLNLPLFSDKEELQNGIPENATRLSQTLINTQGLVIVAPEYNGTFPPSLNNLISWVSKTSDNWRESFNNKNCLIATHSGGGGHHVLMALRHQLAFLGANVLGRAILTTYQKSLDPETLKVCVNNLIGSLK
jgi:chromate reductase